MKKPVQLAMACIIAALLHANVTYGEVRLPHVLGDGMVLQRDMPAPLWGWAEPGEQITVRLGDLSLEPVKAADNGKWSLRLPPHPAGGPVTITIQGKNTLTLQNVLFGDVWVCSGQSNMEWPLFKSARGREDMAVADHPAIRLFTVPHQIAAEPQDDCQGQWVVCAPQTARTFSAVGYYFGRDLHQALNVPIGLIHASFGGTPAGAWTPMPVLEANPDFADIVQRGRDYRADYPQALETYQAALAQWEKDAAQAKADGQPEPRKPRKPQAPDKNPILPSVLYNGKIHPLIPLGIKGVIWYQGENNVTRAQQYRTLLPAMIESWRQAWGQGDFPFGIVQLANFTPGGEEPRHATWAQLREAQAIIARDTPHCGLVTAIDIGQGNNIHPTNKHDVGRRLHLWALATVYGRQVPWSGPVFDKLQIEGDVARITFHHAQSGLRTRDGQELQAFTIAGDDRRFVPAQAAIDSDGRSVLVRSPQVPRPVAVRYGWANNPTCNLYNQDDLPAFPFRTDDWPTAAADSR